MLRPQSGSEHELTDLVTYLRCLAPVLRCMFVSRPNKSFCRCWVGTARLFSFCPNCAGCFAGQCRQTFSLFFSVGSLTCAVIRATLSVYLKAQGSSEQAIGDLLRCLVQKHIYCFVLALSCRHIPTIIVVLQICSSVHCVQSMCLTNSSLCVYLLRHLHLRPPVILTEKVVSQVSNCVGCDTVQADHAPEAGVAQGIFHGILVRHQGKHQEEVEERLEEEVERRVKREHSSNQTQVRMHG